MANEFIARNGLIAQNNSTVTGSLNITGSLLVTGSTTLSGSTDTQLLVGTNSLFVSSSGNVGVGTISPIAKLSVLDTTAASGSANAGSLLDLRQTWNTTGTPTAISLAITDTASNANSKLINLTVGGVNRFFITKNGAGEFAGLVSATGLNNASSTTALTIRGGASTSAIYSIALSPLGTQTHTTGTGGALNINNNNNYNPTSGTGIYNFANIEGGINQSVGSTGITRGLYINPNLTSAFDFRGLEVTKGSIVLPYQAATATYVIKTSDYLLDFTTGTFTATLPTAVGCQGKTYVFKNSGTGIITIATTSSQTIDGVTTSILATQYATITVVSNGANWIKI